MWQLNSFLCGLALLFFGMIAPSVQAIAISCPAVIAHYAPVWEISPIASGNSKAEVLTNLENSEYPVLSQNNAYWITSNEGEITVWSSQTKSSIGGFHRGPKPWAEAVFDHEQMVVRAYFFDGTVRSWDLTGRVVSEYKLSQEIPGAYFSPDGKWLLEVTDNPPPSGASPGASALSEEATSGVQLSDLAQGIQQAILRSGNMDRGSTNLQIRNAADGRLVSTLRSHSHGVRIAQFSEDGEYIATCTRDGVVHVERVRDGAMVYERNFQDKVDIHLSDDGKFLSVAGQKNSYIVKVADGAEQLRISNLAYSVFRPHHDGQMALGLNDGDRLMHLSALPHRQIIKASGQPSRSPVHSMGMISNSANKAISWTFSEDGRYLAVEFADFTFIIFDVDTKQALVQLTGANMPARGRGFTPNAKGFVHLSEDGALRYWELGDKMPRHAPPQQLTPDRESQIVTSIEHGLPRTRISYRN